MGLSSGGLEPTRDEDSQDSGRQRGIRERRVRRPHRRRREVVERLQCAWHVLVQCVGFRCHHKLRTMLPPRSLTRKPTTQACNVQCCPFLVNCLGAPSNKRWRGSWLHCHCAWGASWASWADALPMFQERPPEHAAQIVHNMSEAPAGCLGNLQEASRAGSLWVRVQVESGE